MSPEFIEKLLATFEQNDKLIAEWREQNNKLIEAMQKVNDNAQSLLATAKELYAPDFH